MNKLYEPYLNQIRDVINMNVVTESFEKGEYPHIGGLSEHRDYSDVYKRIQSLDASTSMTGVAKLFGVKNPQKPKLAEHSTLR